MKKIKLFKLLALFIVLITCINTAWAATSTTVYYSVPAGTVGCYTVKLNVKLQRDAENWATHTMTKQGMNGTNVVYACTYTDAYDGVAIMQFQLYDGDTHKSQQQPISSWTGVSTYNGKMYVHDTGWQDKAVDAAVSYRIYFVNKDSWSSRYIYAYYADCHNNWSWAGESMTSASKQYNGKDIYYKDLTSPFPSVIFNDNGSNEESSTSCYSNRGKMYDNGTWKTLQYTVTLNMQSGIGGTGSVNAICGSDMPSATMPTRDGYTFAGYWTNNDGTGTKYYNADGSSAATWPDDGTGPTTLYAHWTLDPGVATLTAAGSATELWIGVNASAALTFTATSSNVSSGTAVTWSLTDNTGDCTVSTTTSSYSGATFSYTPGSTGTKTITVTMTIGGNNYTKTYNLTVYERWNIYVKNNCSWASMALYEYIDGSTNNGAFPGRTAPITGYGVKDWNKVTLDSKWTYFIIDNNQGSSGIEQSYACTTGTSSGTYASGTYWNFVYKETTEGKKMYTLTEMTLSAPTVTINIDKTNVNQITVTGTITAYGGYGETAAEMEAVGFKIGETNYTASYTSGSTFSKTITSLTANKSYTVTAYATSIKATGESDGSSTTTLADESYTIKVQVPHGDAPYVYAWTNGDSYGGSRMTNIADNADLTTGNAPAMTKIITGSSYDWYSYSLHKRYENILFYATKNSNNSQDLTAPRAAHCYWYKKGESTKAGDMDCPYADPQVYIETTAGGGSYTYEAMSTSSPISKTLTLAAKSTYKFKIVYTAEYYGKSSTKLTRGSNTASDLAVDGAYMEIVTDAAGSYTFTYTPGTKTIEVSYQSAYTVDFGASDGGSISATATSASGEMTTGDYVAALDDVSFTQSNDPGYTFKEWNSQADGEGSQLSEETTYSIDDINAHADVYAIFTENMTHVALEHNAHGHVECGGVTVTAVDAGVDTKPSITAVPDAGYYFAGWEPKEGESGEYTIPGAHGESNTTITVTGKGNIVASGQTLIAKFVELDKVYFRNWNEQGNEALWDNVYVYFGISWTGDNRPHSSSISTNIVEMTHIEETNVYWAYVPRAVYTNTNIAFSNYQYSTDYTFDGHENVKWGSYNRKLNMCVPKHYDTETISSVKFYKSYWKNYGLEASSEAGYYLKHWEDSQYKDANIGNGNGIFTIVDENTITYKLRIDNMSDGDNKYMIHSAGGIKYITFEGDVSATGKTITTSACDDVSITQYDEGSPTFIIRPSSEGDYTLTIDQSGDVMKISVNYPVAVGDYILEHSYNDGSAKTSHSSIIKARDASGSTVSMYLYGDHDNDGTIDGTLILRKCTSTAGGTPTWSDPGATVTGYTTANFNKGSGVYKFDVTITTDAVSSIDNIGLYEGNYYIKTDYAPGGWVNYKSNVLDLNTINYSKSDTTTFDYYFCKYVDTKEKDGKRNVKCVIANDYNEQLTDTLIGDAILGLDGGKPRQYLAADASVRFSYNSYTNKLKRAYMNGGATSLKLHDAKILEDSPASTIFNSEGGALAGDQTGLSDLNNWVYTVDIQARETARYRLTADYNFNSTSHLQYLIGASGDLSKSNTKELIGGNASNSTKRSLRVIYDFKTNNLIAAWLVGSDIALAAGKDSALHTDLMIMRVGQGDAYQITFGSEAKFSNVKSIYGVMQLNKSYLLDEANYSQYARDLYWISFPFNVKLSDVFGFGTYGTHWIIEYYDGKSRAQNGFWVDSEPFWKFVTPAMRDTFVLKANEGYILAIDLDQVGESSKVWENSATSAYLYFPSQGSGFTIDEDNVDVSIDQTGYECTINRQQPNEAYNVNKNRTIADSYWHCIGIPSFANNTHATKDNWTIGEGTEDDEVDAGDYPSIQSWGTGDLLFVYRWNSSDNSLVPEDATSFTFNAMHSYMVQYNGNTITWSTVTTPVKSIAARQMDIPDLNFCLQLLKDSVRQDQTFVRFTDKTGVTSGFEFNYDMSKEYNGNRGNIWTLTTNGVQVAGNSMPHPLATTIVPVGVKIATAGDYTFSMPEGTNQENVWLLDNQTGSRTNLGLMPYTVTLTTGTIDGRFSLEFGPIQDAPTGIDEMSTVNSQLSTDSVRKVFVGGRLYIIRDGKAYDATGAQVK